MIYITHCSHKKDEHCKETREAVPPDVLYTAKPTQRFMQRCKDKGVSWAIFSDKYGVWFPEARHEWYEKDPKTLTEAEFSALLADFDEKLSAHPESAFITIPADFTPYTAAFCGSAHWLTA